MYQIDEDNTPKQEKNQVERTPKSAALPQGKMFQRTPVNQNWPYANS